MKIIYNAQSLKIMLLFEKITRAKLKDHFIDDNDLMTFVVSTNVGKAVGKNAVNVKKLERMLNRKIKIIGYNASVLIFMKNLIQPLKVEVKIDDNIITLKSNDTKTKAFLIGRNRSNLNNNTKIIKKYFKEIKEIRIE